MELVIVAVFVVFSLLLFAVMAIGPFAVGIASEGENRKPTDTRIVHLPRREPDTDVEEHVA